MKIVIVGGSGFIGSKLSERFVKQGHSVVSLDMVKPRVAGVDFVKCACQDSVPSDSKLAKSDVYINLAGRSIMGPWTQEHKDSIFNSRIQTTKNIISLFKQSEFRPKVFVQASATGVYGDRGEEVLSEGSSCGEGTFLSHVASNWEREGSKASRYGIRTVILRQGNVLGSAGFLSALRPTYKWGIGGPVGSGNNWLPWVHIEDLISLYVKVVTTEDFSGVVNAVAPESVRYKEFSKTYAKILKRPHFLRVPKFLFRLKYRGFTDEITASQKVVSLRIWELGNVMQYKTLQDALTSIEYGS